MELVAHLAELDARKLYVAEGHGSLFAFCTGSLRLSEHAAYNRIEAARVSRRFPVVLDLLSDGSLNLSTLRLLAPHMRPENFESVVDRARRRSKRDVEALVAELAPRPDVPASVRKLPDDKPITPPLASLALASRALAAPALAAPDGLHPPNGEECSNNQASAALVQDPSTNLRCLPALPAARANSSTSLNHRPVLEPLSPGRFRLQFTMSISTHEKLRRAQDLLRREVPDGNPDSIIDRALALLLEDVARRKLAAASKPRPDRASRSGSRHIPAHIRRAVWIRDGGRCAFVSRNGRHCSERVFLEFHHEEPYAIGGEATIQNISLRCRVHNVHEAELVFDLATASRDKAAGGSVAHRTAGVMGLANRLREAGP